jgi:hypothetical protein
MDRRVKLVLSGSDGRWVGGFHRLNQPDRIPGVNAKFQDGKSAYISARHRTYGC